MRLIALAVASVVAVLFGVGMLMQRTLYGSAVCLLVALLHIAALFYLLGAPLLGFLQVMIYAGAVMVMVVVAIMATPPRLRRLWTDSAMPRPLAVLLIGAVLIEFLVLAMPAPMLGEAGLSAWPTLQVDIAASLFGRYAILTEAVAVLVFLSALAVVEAWKRDVHG